MNVKTGYRIVNEILDYFSTRHIEEIRFKRTLCGKSSKDFRFSNSNYINCSKCRKKYEKLFS